MALAPPTPCRLAYRHACLTATPVPFRTAAATDPQLVCCVRYWVHRLQLDAQLRHWRAGEERLRSLDSNFAGKMQTPIVSEQLLLGDMTYAKLCHAIFLMDNRWHLAPGVAAAEALLVGVNMGGLLGARALSKLEHIVASTRARTITVVMRDDVPIPDDDALGRWCALRERLAARGVAARLFAQNVARLAGEVAMPWPIGLFEDRALEIFLASPRGQLAGQVAQRTRLL
eukprot:535821-Prymnesium_polylepis.1